MVEVLTPSAFLSIIFFIVFVLTTWAVTQEFPIDVPIDLLDFYFYSLPPLSIDEGERTLEGRLARVRCH